MHVREAPYGEFDDVRALLTAAYGQYAASVAEPALFERYHADLIDLDHSAGRAVTLVAEDAGELVGTARFYPAGTIEEVPLPDGWAWVRAVGVRPDRRGDGIARLLMRECTRRAVAAGSVAICLHTITFMADAIRLYERLGYRREPSMDADLAAHYEVAGEMVAVGYRLDL